jgi:ATP-binding cassette subfamily B multidrug efflux pump
VEVGIQSSLNTLMEGKTVIRLRTGCPTIAAMDRLIVLDEGRAVAGDHREPAGGRWVARLYGHTKAAVSG